MLLIFELIWKKLYSNYQFIEEMGCCTSSQQKPPLNGQQLTIKRNENQSTNQPLKVVDYNIQPQPTVQYPPNGTLKCGPSHIQNCNQSIYPHLDYEKKPYRFDQNSTSKIKVQSKINPYYRPHQYQIEIANRQEEMAQNKMKTDGVCMDDYIANRSIFEKCSYCLTQFSQDFKPCLLFCGHYLCKQCFDTTKKCFVKKCSKAATLKLQNYWPWTGQRRNDDDTYDFVIQAGSHHNKSNSLSKISGQQTFGTLLNRIYFVRKFLESIKTENGANLQISSTMRPYREIKDIKISTVAKSLDIQKSYTGYINKIKVVQAEHGGEKQ